MTKTVGEEAAAGYKCPLEFAEDEGIKEAVNGAIDGGTAEAVTRHVSLQHVPGQEDELRERAADVKTIFADSQRGCFHTYRELRHCSP